MGLSVGETVGNSVGGDEGFSLGDPDGEDVGMLLGVSDGDLVGLGVSRFSLKLGRNEGLVDGS